MTDLEEATVFRNVTAASSTAENTVSWELGCASDRRCRDSSNGHGRCLSGGSRLLRSRYKAAAAEFVDWIAGGAWSCRRSSAAAARRSTRREVARYVAGDPRCERAGCCCRAGHPIAEARLPECAGMTLDVESACGPESSAATQRGRYSADDPCEGVCFTLRECACPGVRVRSIAAIVRV